MTFRKDRAEEVSSSDEEDDELEESVEEEEEDDEPSEPEGEAVDDEPGMVEEAEECVRGGGTQQNRHTLRHGLPHAGAPLRRLRPVRRDGPGRAPAQRSSMPERHSSKSSPWRNSVLTQTENT